MAIDHHDPSGPGNHRRHDGGQANGPSAQDSDRLSRRDLERFQHRARAGLDPASQRRKDIERQVRVDPHHIVAMRKRMGREGRLAEDIAADPLITAPDAAFAFLRQPQEIARHEFDAIARLMIMAGPTGAAAMEAQQHMVADGYIVDRGPNRIDHARSFMPQYDREGRGQCAVAHHHVGVAYATGVEPHADLVGTGWVHGQRFEVEGTARCFHHSGPDRDPAHDQKSKPKRRYHSRGRL